jgi:carbon storage regulator
MIANDVVITVSEIRDGQVRLAIDAPRSVAVHREEIYRRIKDEAGSDAVATPVQVTYVRRKRG